MIRPCYSQPAVKIYNTRMPSIEVWTVPKKQAGRLQQSAPADLSGTPDGHLMKRTAALAECTTDLYIYIPT